MTDGHRHREIRVRQDSLLARLLTRPIYWTTDLSWRN